MSSSTASRGLRPRVATARACLRVLVLLAAGTTATVVHAQLIVEPLAHLLASSTSVAPPKPPFKKRPPTSAALSASATPEFALAHHAETALAETDSLLSLVLSTFDPAFADGGSIRAGTSWVGNVTQNPASITVSGTARDENGWGVTGLSLDASAMNSLVITAQRDPGNTAATLFVQFEDLLLRTRIVSVSTSAFALGSLTTVTVPLAAWTVDFGPSQITGWSIGGGGVGTEDFRFTFGHLELSTASAIPEPSTTAALLGAAVLAVTVIRKRRLAAS